MIPTLNNILPNAWWLISCLLMFVSCTNVEEKALQSNTTKDKDIKNYAIINGDSVYVADFNYTIIEDDLEIEVVEGFHAISHDGKYGYLIETGDELYNHKEVLKIVIKDFQTGKTIKSARLKDIIAKSKFTENLEEYNETKAGQFSESMYLNDLHWFNGFYFDYYSIIDVLTSTRGLVIYANWVQGSKEGLNGLFLFISNNLVLEKYSVVEIINGFPRYIIDNDSSFTILSSANEIGIVKKFNEKIDEVGHSGNYVDLITHEVFYLDSNRKLVSELSNMSNEYFGLPSAIINNKVIYLYANFQFGTRNKITVYNNYKKKVFIYTNVEMLFQEENKKSEIYINYFITAINDNYLFVKLIEYSDQSILNRNKKPTIYAIPRKILDYAD